LEQETMSLYCFRDPVRGLVGPVGLDVARDLIQSGFVGDRALVSRDDGLFEPVSALSELRPQAATGQVAAPTLEGELPQDSLIAALFGLHRARETGLLLVHDGDLRKDAYLKDGRPVFLSSNVPSERFGQFLVLNKRIDEHDLGVALESMKTDNNRLGATLVRLGLLEADELLNELRRHHQERLLELCCWQEGRYEFHHGRAGPGDEPDLKVTIPELVVMVVREMPQEMWLPRLAPHLAAVPRLVPGSGHEELPLTEPERRILGCINGRRTGEEILTAAVDADEAAAAPRVLYLLSEIASLEFHPRV
jgi:hypothetical protein